MGLWRRLTGAHRPDVPLLGFGGTDVHETLVEVSPPADQLATVVPEGMRPARDPGGRGLLFATRRMFPELVLEGEPYGPAQVVDLAVLVEPVERGETRPYAQLWWASDHPALVDAMLGAGLHATHLEDLEGQGAPETLVGPAAFRFGVPPPGGFRAGGSGELRRVAVERQFRAHHRWEGRHVQLTRHFRFKREGKGQGWLDVDEDAHLAQATGAGRVPGTAKLFLYDGDDMLTGPPA